MVDQKLSSSSELTPSAASAPAAASSGRAVREVLETLLLAALIFIGVRLVVLNFRVDGESMVPNLHDQEMLLVDRNAYVHFDAGVIDALLPGDQTAGGAWWYPFGPPQRGDIIVFNPPVNSNKPYIKRIVGLPGDHVTFDGGSVVVNGVPLDEPYLDQRTRCGKSEHCDVVVPAGDLFVMGDNRGNSSDSRVFGPVPIDSVIGKAWLGYWPLDAVGFVPHHDYPEVPAAPEALPASS